MNFKNIEAHENALCTGDNKFCSFFHSLKCEFLEKPNELVQCVPVLTVLRSR